MTSPCPQNGFEKSEIPAPCFSEYLFQLSANVAPVTGNGRYIWQSQRNRRGEVTLGGQFVSLNSH